LNIMMFFWMGFDDVWCCCCGRVDLGIVLRDIIDWEVGVGLLHVLVSANTTILFDNDDDDDDYHHASHYIYFLSPSSCTRYHLTRTRNQDHPWAV
jgi:hypothetical protein